MGYRFLTALLLVFAIGCGQAEGKVEDFGGKSSQEVVDTDANLAPDFTLKDLEGNDWTLSAFRGSVVIVAFWAPWCPHCVYEIPLLDSLHTVFADSGLVVVGIGIDRVSALRGTVDEKGLRYTILVDENGSVAKQYGVQGIPTTFIIDREGKVAYYHVGYHPSMNEGIVQEVKDVLSRR